MGTPLDQLSSESTTSRIMEPFMEELGERKEIISSIGNDVQALSAEVVHDPKRLDPATLSKILTSIARLQSMNPVSEISKKQKISFWLKKRGVTVLYSFFALGSSSALGSIVSAIYQYSQFSNCHATIESANFYNATTTSSSSDGHDCYLTLAPVILSSVQLLASITGSVFTHFQKKQFQEEEDDDTRRLRELITLTASENAAAKQWEEFFQKFQRFQQTARCEQRRASIQEELIDQTSGVRDLLDCYRGLPKLPIFPMHFSDSVMADVLIRTLPDHSPVRQVMDQISSRIPRPVEQTPVEDFAPPLDEDPELAHPPIPLHQPTLRPETMEMEMDDCHPHEIPIAQSHRDRFYHTSQDVRTMVGVTQQMQRHRWEPPRQNFAFPPHPSQQQDASLPLEQSLYRHAQTHNDFVPIPHAQRPTYHEHPSPQLVPARLAQTRVRTYSEFHAQGDQEVQDREVQQVFQENVPRLALPSSTTDPMSHPIGMQDIPFSQTYDNIQHLRQPQAFTGRCITPIHLRRQQLLQDPSEGQNPPSTLHPPILIAEGSSRPTTRQRPPPSPRLTTEQQQTFDSYLASRLGAEHHHPSISPRLPPRDQEQIAALHLLSRLTPRERPPTSPGLPPKEQELSFFTSPPSPRTEGDQQQFPTSRSPTLARGGQQAHRFPIHERDPQQPPASHSPTLARGKQQAHRFPIQEGDQQQFPTSRSPTLARGGQQAHRFPIPERDPQQPPASRSPTLARGKQQAHRFPIQERDPQQPPASRSPTLAREQQHPHPSHRSTRQQVLHPFPQPVRQQRQPMPSHHAPRLVEQPHPFSIPTREQRQPVEAAAPLPHQQDAQPPRPTYPHHNPTQRQRQQLPPRALSR